MHVPEVEVPFLADAAIAAAQLAIHVVDEGALSTVFEEDSHDAGSTRHDRGHDLDYRTDAPLLVARMEHAITQTEKEPFLFIEHVVTNGDAG